ncbi:MAG: hypothetical protein HQ541_13990 [Mariniphaga sp.]|nr:hypothetical protein [Mariniphaga sp.]
MKKGLLFALFFGLNTVLLAQTEIGPEGHKLIWVFVILIPLVVFVSIAFLKKIKSGKNTGFLKRTKIEISLVKDRLYYPDFLKLTVKNKGNSDIDLDQPLLVFDNFWLKRKFKLKGTNNHTFYPLFLKAGETHDLQIDLNGFYRHDKSLKKYPKTKVIIYNVKKRRLGSKSVYLRKTLFKY